MGPARDPRIGSGPDATLLARYVWNSRSVGLALVDPAGRVVDANEQLSRIARTRIVGRRVEEIVLPAQRPALAALVAGAGPDWSSLRLGLAPDGRGIPQDYLVSAASVEQDVLVVAEPLVGDVAAVNDQLLTLAAELVEVERQLRRRSGELVEQNERLVELDRLKDQFVSLISHEFRTPLTSMHGYLELLREDEGAFAPKQREFLEVLERNAMRLLRLVDDLLFVAELDAGKLQLVLETLDPAALAREAVAAIRPIADRKGVAVQLSAERAPHLLADRARLAQLLDNLLTNGVKFTPGGGRVDVAVSRAGERAVVEVRDTGIGIPPDEREHVFERFFRTSRAARRTIPGSGLGLAVAKSIVEAHEGTIGVTSPEGGGSVFRVELPLGGPSSGSSAPHSAGAR